MSQDWPYDATTPASPAGAWDRRCCADWLDDDFDLAHGDECELALHEAHAFLHGELSDQAGDAIRRHLIACESCMDYYHAEEIITALLRRCQPPAQASATLRVRVASLHVDVAMAA